MAIANRCRQADDRNVDEASNDGRQRPIHPGRDHNRVGALSREALGDYLHARGLKFGIYQAPLDRTCAQYFNSYPGATGSQGHEVQDARQFAESFRHYAEGNRLRRAGVGYDADLPRRAEELAAAQAALTA